MRINVYPADGGGCGHYRMIWPAEYLASQGHDINVIRGDEPEARQVMALWLDRDGGTRELVDVSAPEADVIVLQRPLSDTLSEAIPMLQSKGVKVVVEIDDDFEAVSPRNVSWEAIHPGRSPRRNWVHLRNACERADLVVVSTPALADVYGRHGRVVVVPNCIPSWYLDVERTDHDETFVGWSGSVETHPDDLQVCGAGVTRALRATDAKFAVIGTGKGVRTGLGLDAPPLACGWQLIEHYPRQMAELDIGIVPLELSRFNESKSWLKGLEFAALGVPFLASPTNPYCRLNALGAGWIADRPKSWEGMLKRLIRSADDRAELAAAGRDVARTLTIEGNAERWLDAWTSAVNTSCAS